MLESRTDRTMGFFRRILSAEYRRAVSAEAQGDFLTAAKCYALCGEGHKVVDMHLARARVERSPEERLLSLRTALGLTPQGDTRRSMVLRLLGRALVDRGHETGVATTEGQAYLREAAGILEEGELFEQAGDVSLELGDRAAAAAVFSRAGLVERVEEVLGEEERRQQRTRREERCFAEYESLLSEGKRDEAAEALRDAIEAASAKGEYRRLLAELERKLLNTGRVALSFEGRRVLLLGRFPILLGRDGDADLLLRGHTVSRHHARIHADPERGFVLEDCGSRNGTQLGALTIEASLPLPPSGEIGLGESCSLRFEVGGGGGRRLRLEVGRGLDLGFRATCTASPVELEELFGEGAPRLTIAFARGRPIARSGRVLLLNSARVGSPVQLVLGDELEIEDDGRRVSVVE
jgi:hypothetical protein